ncbi:MAG: fumarylacetoacetate hydrolase family protein [Planctomycetaceae bacterium]
MSPDMKIRGYSIGNDMSARDIEGENPLYLPQAKVYNQSCALGPVVLLATAPLDPAETRISLEIQRQRRVVFSGETNVAQLNRKLDDLADWLGRQLDFPMGAVLLTGTGVIPPDEFTLENGDLVSIEISGIGRLVNPVVKD